VSKIRRLLIANRGEIARRIQRTCRGLGIETVAVFSEADAGMPFVDEADFAVCIGPAAAAESYLSVSALLDAAKRAGADAVHPGYGFLSENADFAQAVADAGMVFVGPSPAAIRAMGSKIEAKRHAQAAGVPVVPGYNGDSQSDEALVQAAQGVGFPLLVKASAGGGGKGMRAVYAADDLLASIHGARREAQAAFGDGALMLERYIQRPRHVEIQILGDSAGEVVSLFERECSIQRRHQKVIEEAPSVALTPAAREAMGDAAARLARAIGYTNAGTVEFILDPDGSFYFLEVNTRLQVEHPVTEHITGLDLVREQLLIAQGQPLSPEVKRAVAAGPQGASVECRLYAEDPSNQFLPCIGPVLDFHWPPTEGLRVDSGVEAGCAVGVHYDPMLAKVITWGRDRAEATQRMIHALRGASVMGLQTNLSFLIDVLSHPAYAAGDLHTHFIDQHLPQAERAPSPSAAATRLAIIAAVVARWAAASADPQRPLPNLPTGFRNNRWREQRLSLDVHGAPQTAAYSDLGDRLRVTCGGHASTARLISRDGASLRLDIDGLRFTARVIDTGAQAFVHTRDAVVTLHIHPRLTEPTVAADPGACTAPMPGKVLRVLVSAQQQVAEGDPLLILEAMKMEHTVRAPTSGTITDIHVSPGDQVEAQARLVSLTPRSP
jgi:acetyl/propionyl-CoA carboxylase alpha subunit